MGTSAGTWDASVQAALDAIDHPVRQRDARTLVELMARVTGEKPRMWGKIFAFGTYHYRYASGREGDSAAAAFAPRKGATVIYCNDGVEHSAELLSALGPHSTGVGCLYIKDLSQVDLSVLEEIVRRSYETLTAGPEFTNRAREG